MYLFHRDEFVELRLGDQCATAEALQPCGPRPESEDVTSNKNSKKNDNHSNNNNDNKNDDNNSNKNDILR